MERYRVKVLAEFKEGRLPVERRDELARRIDDELGSLQAERERLVKEIERLSIQREENLQVIRKLSDERTELAGRIKEAEKLLKELSQGA